MSTYITSTYLQFYLSTPMLDGSHKVLAAGKHLKVHIGIHCDYIFELNSCTSIDAELQAFRLSSLSLHVVEFW